MTLSKFITYCFALWAHTPVLYSAEPVFNVVPPEELQFNYPDPPQEGVANYFVIAADGKARCAIVYSDSATPAMLAAVREFATYLKLSTGAEFLILPERKTPPRGLGEIHVGDTQVAQSLELALPKLRYGNDEFENLRGYVVKTLDPKRLVVRGVNEKATGHGLVGFLKRFVGIRQYWHSKPGRIQSVIPEHSSLSIPKLEWRDWPYFTSFQMSMRPFLNRPALDFYRRINALPPNENYDQWLRPSRYVESNPEYFALVNGERLKPTDDQGSKGWQPCVSNPEVQQVMGNAVIEYFRKHPQVPGINVAINDGGGDCTCDKCRALDGPKTDYSRGIGMSDRYVYFTNRICEIVGLEFPDKFIVYLAYASASAAPQTVKPHPRLLPVTTTASTFDRWDEWVVSGAEHLGVYAHHLGTFALLPKMDVHQQEKRLRYVVGSGKARTYYMECHTQWPYSDLVPYITAELTWDPRADVDALLDEYFSKFYRRAEKPMREYYSALTEGYQRWLAEHGRPHGFGRDISSYYNNKLLDQFKVLTPDEAARAMQALDRAMDAAESDSIVSQRVGIVRAAFGLQKIGVERGWAAFRLRDTETRSLAEAQARVDDARLIYERSRDAQDYIENVLEKSPCDEWLLFRNMAKPLAIYTELKSGEPGPEIRSIISLGLSSVERYLRDELGSKGAATWWQRQADDEPGPALKESFRYAAERALAPPPKNLLENPGFENFTGPAQSKSGEALLDANQIRTAGVHLTFPDRTPFRIAISSEYFHSGKHSLMLEHCARARLTRHIPAQPNTRYRAGLWFRQNEGTASAYQFTIDVRLKDGSYKTLSNLTIPDQPNQWRPFLADVLTPLETTTLFVRLHLRNQAAGTRCWIDDVFVYPNEAD